MSACFQDHARFEFLVRETVGIGDLAALDAEAEHDLFRRWAVAAARGGGVTVLVSHRLSTVRMADLVVVLDQGRVEEAGTHDDLIRPGGRYARLFRLGAAAVSGGLPPVSTEHQRGRRRR
ncbi:hypothetical protein [Nonomuraea rubra]|uniref:ABC-type microcin C transport system duplicated ATPase subunit YejF n=1 Tax=Nonomuraea rubra TaxID=46180 RepID=A0A7X0U4N8_9ACTN|nr:hypothetical protein [Nonomuraea rubra]MBB6555182.1 ABC-type microcin C transport system duplicated ATPase subunit YejF [Nonomuraea rubra]